MKFPTSIFIGAVFIAASASAQIRVPHLGFAGSADGTLRPVYGVAGNFVIGSSISAKVLSQAFSGSLGLLKTDSTLSAFDGQGRVLGTIEAAAGQALFAFSSDGVTALAYIASSDTLVRWSAGRFQAVPFRSEPDPILAIALSSGEATLIVQRPNGIWEVGPASQRALVGVTSPLLALASGELVYSDAKGIVLRNPDGAEVHIAGRLPAKFSFQQMDASWVQLSDLASARRFAIRVLPGHAGFYELPEAGR